MLTVSGWGGSWGTVFDTSFNGTVMLPRSTTWEHLASVGNSVANHSANAQHWVDLAIGLERCGLPLEALVKLDRAISIAPALTRAHWARANILLNAGLTEHAMKEWDQVVTAEPADYFARSRRLLALQSVPGITPGQIFDEHRAYGEAVGKPDDDAPPCDGSLDKKLRLAILSPDFCHHACAYFIEPLLQHLDPMQFELFLYHDNALEDDVSARLRTYANLWRNVANQSDALVKRTIRGDRPDILIDLAGHCGTRLPVIARRLAPVQVTYLGYPDTTGVAAVDFRLTDGTADPEGVTDAFATEHLIRFAPVAWAYLPPEPTPAVEPPPCLATNSVTFGCLNDSGKLNQRALALFSRILAGVPNSRLLLKYSQVGRDVDALSEQHRSTFCQFGVDPRRVIALPWQGFLEDHFRTFSYVDVALDPFPYNGTTTTCETLWMGRPVVTLRGDRHASRVGASILTAVGHPEWIAATADEYVQRAVSLATDPGRIAAAARTLRDDMQASPLMDHKGQSARFAAALRECWREKCHAAGDTRTTG